MVAPVTVMMNWQHGAPLPSGNAFPGNTVEDLMDAIIATLTEEDDVVLAVEAFQCEHKCI